MKHGREDREPAAHQGELVQVGQVRNRRRHAREHLLERHGDEDERDVDAEIEVDVDFSVDVDVDFDVSVDGDVDVGFLE